MDALIPDDQGKIVTRRTPPWKTGRAPGGARAVRAGGARAVRRNDVLPGAMRLEGLSRSVHLDRGMYELTVAPAGEKRWLDSGVSVPMTQICPAAGSTQSWFEIVSPPGESAGWVGAEGGILFVRSSDDGGSAVITTYGVPAGKPLPKLSVRRIDPESHEALPPMAADGAVGRAVDTEIVLHIERLGDRHFASGQWAGHVDPRLRIEGISLRPLNTVPPDQVEYMGFHPGGARTAWVAGAALCGSRGRGLPLTGFAVRLSPELASRFDVVYEGFFLAGGAEASRRNGESCVGNRADDPLCAVRVDIIERVPEAAAEPTAVELSPGMHGDAPPVETVVTVQAPVSPDPTDEGAAASPEPTASPENIALPPLLHQIRFEMDLIREAFDAEYYVNTYHDIQNFLTSGGIEPIEHFCAIGWRENRNPCSWFSVKDYRTAYTDVAESMWNPFAHYIGHGKDEGRAICPAGSALTREQELTAELARAHEDLNVARKSFDAERTADREQLAAARKVNQSLFAALRDEPSLEGAVLALPRGGATVWDRLSRFRWWWWRRAAEL